MDPWNWSHAGVFRVNGRSRRMSRPRRWLPVRNCTFVMLLKNFRLLLRYRPHMGIRLAAYAGDFDARSGVWRARYEYEEPVVKKKQVKADMGEATHLAPMESNILSKHVPLVAHCAVRKYDDGDPREPGWFTVKTMGSAWCVQVKDPDTAASFVAVAPTIDDALALASLLLESDEAPWERDQWLLKNKSKKK